MTKDQDNAWIYCYYNLLCLCGSNLLQLESLFHKSRETKSWWTTRIDSPQFCPKDITLIKILMEAFDNFPLKSRMRPSQAEVWPTLSVRSIHINLEHIEERWLPGNGDLNIGGSILFWLHQIYSLMVVISSHYEITYINKSIHILLIVILYMNCYNYWIDWTNKQK